MGQAAKVLNLVRPAQTYERGPDQKTRTRGNGRAIAVAKFRELADKLESGELDGARCQWLDTHGLLVEVEVNGAPKQVQLNDGDDMPEGGIVVSGLEFVTRTAWREDGAGTVALVATTIEETGSH